MLRVINEQGTAIVLVEQSVNIALSVVHHAYFMEKGEIRFDGASKDLLSRPDLLRSVFLEGASQGIAASNGRG
jgi:ABC-type branched-subunit amino acid transport system ATPase component